LKGIVDRNVVPTQIIWGGNVNTGVSDRFKVEFVSDWRPHDTSVDDASNQYGGIQGTVRETHQLNAIKVLSNRSNPI
jgi:hypothetical protein